jgi:hypothetical protein
MRASPRHLERAQRLIEEAESILNDTTLLRASAIESATKSYIKAANRFALAKSYQEAAKTILCVVTILVENLASSTNTDLHYSIASHLKQVAYYFEQDGECRELQLQTLEQTALVLMKGNFLSETILVEQQISRLLEKLGRKQEALSRYLQCCLVCAERQQELPLAIPFWQQIAYILIESEDCENAHIYLDLCIQHEEDQTTRLLFCYESSLCVLCYAKWEQMLHLLQKYDKTVPTFTTSEQSLFLYQLLDAYKNRDEESFATLVNNVTPHTPIQTILFDQLITNLKKKWKKRT